MTLDPQSCRALAVEMVFAAVNDLKAHHKQRDIDFFLSPERSELWCVGAGLDYDATISRLRRDGHLVAAPPAPRPAPRQPVRTPTRDAAYQREFRRRLLARLPRSSETACTTAALAQSLGVYRKAVQNVLAPPAPRRPRDVPVRGTPWRHDGPVVEDFRRNLTDRY